MIDVHQVDAGAMATRTVELVRGWLEDGTTTAGIAVLARVNSALLPVQVALVEAGIDRTAPLDPSVLGRTGIRTALAYLRIGLDPERLRREDLLETLRRPSRKLVGALTPLLRRSNRWSRSQLDGVLGLLEGRYADRFGDYLADLDHLTDVITGGGDTGVCLRVIRDRIGLGDAMATLDGSTTRPEGSSHGDDLDALEQLAALHPDPVTFRDWLVEALRVEGVRDGVTLSTVHRVKGMEWDRVVVFAATAGLFPHRLADDEEEERRVLHVAITRCREQVAVVSDRAAPSPFLAQLHSRPTRPTPSDPRPPSPAPRPARFVDGDLVVAEVGLRVTLAGGFDGAVVEVADGVATVRVDMSAAPGQPDAPADGPADGPALDVPVAFGDRVVVDGRTATLAAPRVAAAQPAPEPDVDEDLFETLKTWRGRIAAERGFPAYVVLHDSHLRAIAASRPRTLEELSGCPGIGPTKLDRYGDDILALVDAGA